MNLFRSQCNNFLRVTFPLYHHSNFRNFQSSNNWLRFQKAEVLTAMKGRSRPPFHPLRTLFISPDLSPSLTFPTIEWRPSLLPPISLLLLPSFSLKEQLARSVQTVRMEDPSTHCPQSFASLAGKRGKRRILHSDSPQSAPPPQTISSFRADFWADRRLEVVALTHGFHC